MNAQTIWPCLAQMWAAQQLSASQGEAGEPVLGQGHIKEAGAEGESMAKAAPRS